MEPRNRFQGMTSASLCSLAGRYENRSSSVPSPHRLLKIPARRQRRHSSIAGGKSSFKLVRMESTSPYNSLISYSLNWRCCSLVWPKSLVEQCFDRLLREQSSFRFTVQNAAHCSPKCCKEFKIDPTFHWSYISSSPFIAIWILRHLSKAIGNLAKLIGARTRDQ